MTRQAMGTPGGLVMPGQPLTFDEVIHGSTLGSARLQDRGDVLGSLDEGKIADTTTNKRRLADWYQLAAQAKVPVEQVQRISTDRLNALSRQTND